MQSVNEDVCASFTGTDERNRPTDNYRVIAFLNIMPCIYILFLFMNFFELHKEIHRVHIFYLTYCRFLLVFEITKNLRNHRRSAQITEHKINELRGDRVSSFNN